MKAESNILTVALRQQRLNRLLVTGSLTEILDALAARDAPPHPQARAERQELRIGFDVGDEVEHLRRLVAHAPRRVEGRHVGP